MYVCAHGHARPAKQIAMVSRGVIGRALVYRPSRSRSIFEKDKKKKRHACIPGEEGQFHWARSNPKRMQSIEVTQLNARTEHSAAEQWGTVGSIVYPRHGSDTRRRPVSSRPSPTPRPYPPCVDRSFALYADERMLIKCQRPQRPPRRPKLQPETLLARIAQSENITSKMVHKLRESSHSGKTEIAEENVRICGLSPYRATASELIAS